MHNFTRWVVVGTVAFAGACGDSGGAGNSESAGGSGSSGGRLTEGGETTSGGSNSESASAGLTEGSNSDSATMATTHTTCGDTQGDTQGGGTTSAVSESGGGSTGSDTSATTGGTTGMMQDCIQLDCTSTGDGSSTGGGGEPPGPCNQSNTYTLDGQFDEGAYNNVHHDAPDNDQLQLRIDGFFKPDPIMYVAHTDEGRVLKIDTETGKQLARYPSQRTADCMGCPADPAVWKPSRIVIDLEGDMYVANRAFNTQGSLTKIAGTEKNCVDRNGNGVIDTSRDENLDGIIDVADPEEYKDQDDECVLWSIPVGGVNTVLRALALDGKGHAYVGGFNEYKAYKFDVTQSPPVLVDTFDLGSRPYGFVVRGKHLYHSALNWAPTSRFDLETKDAVNINVLENYGLTVDSKGKGWFGSKYGVARCDYDTSFCDSYALNDKIFGLTVDQHDQIWAASLTAVYKLSNDGALLGKVDLASGYGAAIGHNGNPIIIGWYSIHEVESGPKGGPPGAVKDIWSGHLDNLGAFNYTYSDYTGFLAHNITMKKGEWTVVHDGLVPGATWAKVPYNTEPEGKVPAGTTLSVQARAADAKADLADQPWALVVDGALPGGVVGRFIEVRVQMSIDNPDGAESPVLSDLCVLKAGE